jgi:two-component system probable response regulator PhcQ
MNRILLVDDEQNVLNALRRELHDDFEVEAFAVPRDALARSHDATFDLAVADYAMPDMTGIQFLKQFAEIQPRAARLMLSGQADIQGLVGAINETHVYRFIEKPWEEAELKSAIAQALNYCRILQENERLAEVYRGRSVVAEPSRSMLRQLYRIAVVSDDTALVGLIRNALVADAGHEASNDALWREISRDIPNPPGQIEFRVETFGSGAEALNRAWLATYDLVIAAQDLPDMDGFRFLGQWMLAQPTAARMLMGRPADFCRLMKAINEASVYSFLDFDSDIREMNTDSVRRRTWQVHRLQSSIMEALAARELALENDRLAQEIRKCGW